MRILSSSVLVYSVSSPSIGYRSRLSSELAATDERSHLPATNARLVLVSVISSVVARCAIPQCAVFSPLRNPSVSCILLDRRHIEMLLLRKSWFFPPSLCSARGSSALAFLWVRCLYCDWNGYTHTSQEHGCRLDCTKQAHFYVQLILVNNVPDCCMKLLSTTNKLRTKRRG